MNTDTIAECMRLSFADTPFPEVVQKLAEAGVRGYSADLVALRETCYGSGTQAADEPMPLSDPPVVGIVFDAAAIEAAVRAIQRKEIGYAQFLRSIMLAGCARYGVFFGARKAMYFGRDGDFYTEPFQR